MIVVRIFILFILFVPGFKMLAQQKIVKKTYSIVDTSGSKIEQAKEIYTWITNNIEYDTKQLKKGIKYYSSAQTLRRKKAVCYGYSELFFEMCNALDIDAYIINGYCKGFGYVKNENFIKGNHSWNILHIDSSLIIVDATWGSGTLSYEYDIITKLKQSIKKNSGIKDDIKFYPSPNPHYFNIKPTEIISTRFPLDAKWQLQEYPISYHSFILGEYETTGYLNYYKEILKVKHISSDHQAFIDALNSTQYNPFNKFDVAYQYFYQANNLKVGKHSPLDSLLLKRLYKSVSYYDSALVYLKDFKNISRDFYLQKKQSQKLYYRTGANALKQIGRIPTSANGKYENKYKRLKRNEIKLSEIEGRIYPEGLFIDKEIKFSYQQCKHSDSIQIKRYKDGLRDKLQRISKYIPELNQTKEELEKEFSSDVGQSDSLIKHVKKIVKYQADIWNSLEYMDEFKVLRGCKNLGVEFSKYDSILEIKLNIQENIEKYFSQIGKKYEITERTLYSILRDYDKLAKATSKNEFYSNKANRINTMLHELYRLKYEMLKNLQLNNKDWKKLVYMQNQILTLYPFNRSNNLSKNLEQYYAFISNANNFNYLNEMNVYNEIKTQSKKKINALNKIIKATEKQLKQNSKDIN